MTTDANDRRSVLLTDRPAHRTGLLVEQVGDELVVFDPDTRLMHRLDPRACLIWQLLDGQTPLGSTCEELADGLGVPLDQVRTDVLSLVSDLVDRGLVVPQPGASTTNERDVGADGDGDDDGSVPEDDGYWVPMRMTGCVEVVTRLGWQQTIGIELDGRAVGVRAATEALGQAVRDLFGAHVVETDEGTFPNLSVRDPAVEADGTQELGRVYRHCTLVARPADREGVLTALLRETEGELAPHRGGGVRFHGTALLVDGSTAVLAPSPAWQRLVPHSRRLADLGLELLARDVVLDPEGAVAVVPRTAFTVDLSVLGQAGRSLASDRRYPIGGWLFETGQDAGLRVAAGKAALMAQGMIVNGPLLSDGEALHAVTSVLHRVPAVTYVGEWRSIAEVAGDCVRRV